MKRLVMVSVESVFSGVVKSGMAELVDSLANSLSRDYEVTIVCINGHSVFASTAGDLRTISETIQVCRFSAVDYYLIDSANWLTDAASVIDSLKPDILHNLAEPELISLLTIQPKKTICTFDHAKYARGKEKYLQMYDSVTTSSETYAKEVLAEEDELAKTLRTLDFTGVTAGILDVAFSPEKGLLLPTKYTSEDQTGKQICKQRLLKTYGIKNEPYICLMMCRLVKEKGFEEVFNCIDTIRDTGGILIIVGKGAHEYEQRLRKFRRSEGVVYIDRWASPIQAAPLAAAADFYLNPSIDEPCGLMPMTASRYGTIPIVTKAGGLADNFDDNNAIIVNENGLLGAINKAAEIYKDKEQLKARRKVCMEQDFSWTTRKANYIKIYEKE